MGLGQRLEGEVLHRSVWILEDESLDGNLLPRRDLDNYEVRRSVESPFGILPFRAKSIAPVVEGVAFNLSVVLHSDIEICVLIRWYILSGAGRDQTVPEDIHELFTRPDLCKGLSGGSPSAVDLKEFRAGSLVVE